MTLQLLHSEFPHTSIWGKILFSSFLSAHTHSESVYKSSVSRYMYSILSLGFLLTQIPEDGPLPFPAHTTQLVFAMESPTEKWEDIYYGVKKSATKKHKMRTKP
jgi:hypothetical protein